MAYWTVIGTGKGGDVAGKTFGVTLDTETGQWTAGGGSVSAFFTSKSGKFKFALLPENGTQLVDGQNVEVAFFTALNGSSAVGQTGEGRAGELAVHFSRRLDSK